MTKTSVKFRKNRHKTVGGVAHTRCISTLGGRKDGERNAENYVPPLFFEKAGDNKVTFLRHVVTIEPRLEKTGFLHMRKQRRRSAQR